MIHHGGNLFSIAAQYNSEPDLWLDLSTGVSPFAYPVTSIPASSWHHLPQKEDGLDEAAANYYLKHTNTDSLLAVCGSQAGIMALPTLLFTHLKPLINQQPDRVVLLPRVGYKEHEKAWLDMCKKNAIPYEFYDLQPSIEQIEKALILLVINVNNPTGYLTPKQILVDWQQRLKTNGGYLVVDEAFIDLIEENSLLPERHDFQHLIVLRSMGKFFGLAGIRVGFVFLEPELKEQLQLELGPWTIPGVSRYMAQQALRDKTWQQQQKSRVRNISNAQMALLVEHFGRESVVQAPFFIRVELDDAQAFYQALCKQYILLRLCDEGDAVRFGLVENEKQLLRLKEALQSAS